MLARAVLAAAYNHMKLELQKFMTGRIPKNPENIGALFDMVLSVAGSNVEWCDDDITSIYYIAGGVFVDGDDKAQAMAFDFMRKLIDIFNFERSSKLNGMRVSFVTTLLKFYFSVVLQHANKSALFTKASSHAAEHVRDNHPYRQMALQTFGMSWFADYPIERYEKEAVKNLLIIAKEKMLCNNVTDPLMPGTLRFIEKVCEKQFSCGVVIHVCDLLGGLFQCLNWDRTFSKFDMFKGSPVFPRIMDHIKPYSFRKKCWVAVARFIKATFLFGDDSTKGILVAEGVFERIHEMLVIDRKELLFELLETVEVVSKDRRYVCRLVTEDIIYRILLMTQNIRDENVVRQRLCLTVSGFLTNAPDSEVYRAAEEGVLTVLGRLLKSRSETNVCDALKWIRMVLDNCQDEPMRTGLVALVVQEGIDVTLEWKSRHPTPCISDPARYLLTRLRPDPEVEKVSFSWLSSIASWATESTFRR